jgi:serine/threonine protein kinase
VLGSAGPEWRVALQEVLDGWRKGRWVVLDDDELGRGGSGVVLKCSDSRLGQIAVKFSYSDEPRKLEREAALMQRVAHDNVCRLYEYHVFADGRLFGMMLELLETGSLTQRIKDGSGGRIR